MKSRFQRLLEFRDKLMEASSDLFVEPGPHMQEIFGAYAVLDDKLREALIQEVETEKESNHASHPYP